MMRLQIVFTISLRFASPDILIDFILIGFVIGNTHLLLLFGRAEIYCNILPLNHTESSVRCERCNYLATPVIAVIVVTKSVVSSASILTGVSYLLQP